MVAINAPMLFDLSRARQSLQSLQAGSTNDTFAQPSLAETQVLLQAYANVPAPPPGLGMDLSAVSGMPKFEDSTCGSTAGESDDVAEPVSPSLPPQAPGQKAQTSLMIRNVPILYSREMLLSEWPNNGTYDFFYLPWNAETNRNLSYCFVNFTTEAEALAFVKRWQKQRLPHYTAKKPLNISFADIQGFADNLKIFRKRRVDLAECPAVVFKNGRRVDLQEALEKVLNEEKAERQAAWKAASKNKSRAAAKTVSRQAHAAAKKSSPAASSAVNALNTSVQSPSQARTRASQYPAAASQDVARASPMQSPFGEMPLYQVFSL